MRAIRHPHLGLRVLVATGCASLLVMLAAATPAAAHDGHRVRRGETLSEIAQALGVSTVALARANGIDDHDLVYAGTWLVAPGGSTGSEQGAGSGSGGGTGGSSYQVRAGETLSEIAVRHGLSTAALARANGIADPDLVFAGTTLTIPAGTGGGSDTPAPADGGVPSGGGDLPTRLLERPDRLALLPVFDQWAAHYGLPADLLKAVTYLESGWQAGIVSPDGAIGIGQLLPITVDHMRDVIGLQLDPWDPSDNIRMSARLLRLLIDETGGTRTALAAYYQGLGSIERNGVYPSTLDYVDGVSALRSRFG